MSRSLLSEKYVNVSFSRGMSSDCIGSLDFFLSSNARPSEFDRRSTEIFFFPLTIPWLELRRLSLTLTFSSFPLLSDERAKTMPKDHIRITV